MNNVQLKQNLINIFLLKKPAPGFSTVIYKDSKCIFDFSMGEFSPNNSAKISINTPYDIASISKLYTAAIIIELWQQKKLSIFDLCSKYLPSFSESNLSIIDLLTHRANFNIRLSEYRQNFKSSFSDVLQTIKPPISKSNKTIYENLTYIYLGEIIQSVTGRTINDNFIDFISKHNLTNTFTGKGDPVSFSSPPTEIIDSTEVVNCTHDESARLLGGVAGNAGVFASSEGLAQFGNLWLTNDIAPFEVLNRFVFKNYEICGNSAQGIGWWMRLPYETNEPYEIFNHSGYTGSLLAIDLKKKIVISLTCNRTYFGRDNQNHKLLWKEIVNYIKVNDYP